MAGGWEKCARVRASQGAGGINTHSTRPLETMFELGLQKCF